MSFDILLGCFFLNFSSAVLVPVVRECNHRNDLSDLFPPAFVNSLVVQADGSRI